MRERWVLRLAAVALAAAPLLRAQAAGATTVTVRAASTRAAAGQSVSIPIDLRGARDIGAMHLELVFDAAILQPDTVERGALLGGGNALMESNTSYPGRVVISLISLQGISGDGTVAMVRFRVLGKGGQQSALRFESSRAWERTNHIDVVVNEEAGQVTVQSGWPLLLIAAGLALLVLLIVVFFLRRRGRR